MKNKILALLLAMTMCSSALAGCANETNSGSTETIQSDVTSEETSALSASTEGPDEPLANVDIYPLESDKTFTVVINSCKNLENDGSTIVTQAMEEATGVKINWAYMADEQAKLAVTSKEFPDAYFLYAGAMDKTTAYEFGKAGYFVNFMDYLDIMPNFSAVIEEHPEYLDPVKNDDGSVYMLPRILVTSTAQSNMLYYRTDMMKEIGWEKPPATTDEFLQFVKELQAHYGAKDPEFIAFSAYQSNQMVWSAQRMMGYFFPAFGELLEAGITLDSNDKVVFGAATEQYKHFMEFMNELWNTGAFNTNIYTQDATASKAAIAGGHVAISPVNTGFSTSVFPSGNMDLDVLAPLTSEYQDTPQWWQKDASSSSVSMISTKCEDIETMVKWFDAWYSTRENPLTEDGSVFGITPWLGKIGIDFVLDDSTMCYTEQEHSGIEYGQFLSTQSFGSSLYSGFDDGNFLYNLPANTGVGVKGHGTIANLWPYAKRVTSLTSLALTQDESDIYNEKWTDINAYIKDTTAKFITGEMSIAENWDAYLAMLERMGMKEMLAVFEAAYARTK